MKTIVERGASWGLEETKLLLSLWGLDLVQRQTTNIKRTKEVYEKISEKLNQNGYERTADQVRTRVFNMIAEYRRILRDPNPERAKKCIFFDALDKIYQAKHMDDIKSALDDYEPEGSYSPGSATTVEEKGDESMITESGDNNNEATSTNNSSHANSLTNAAIASHQANSVASVAGINMLQQNQAGISQNITMNPLLGGNIDGISINSGSNNMMNNNTNNTNNNNASSSTNSNNSNAATNSTVNSPQNPQTPLPNHKTLYIHQQHPQQQNTTCASGQTQAYLTGVTSLASSGNTPTTSQRHQSLLLPHATASSSSSTSTSTPLTKLTNATGTSTPSYISINSAKVPIIRTNQLIGHATTNGSEPINLNGTPNAARLQPTTATIASHQLYQAPVNTFDVTSSALLIDRVFAHMSRESENMREWIALEKERLAFERTRRQQETEREVRRERILIETLSRFQEQWLAHLSKLTNPKDTETSEDNEQEEEGGDQSEPPKLPNDPQ